MKASDHRVVDELGVVCADAFRGVVRREFAALESGRFEVESLRERPLPVRVVQVAFEGGVADVLVVVTSAGEELAVEATATAAGNLAGLLGGDVAVVGEPQVHEFTDAAALANQLEALWSEPFIELGAVGGNFLVVFGSGLVETATQRLLPPEPAGADGAGDDALAAMFATEAPAPVAATPAPGAADETIVRRSPSFDVADLRWTGLIQGVEVEIAAELGRTELGLGEVDALGGGSVLTLDQGVEEPVRLFVNGALYATGKLIVVGDEYGVEVVEVLHTGALPTG